MNLSPGSLLFYLDKRLTDLKNGGILRFGRISRSQNVSLTNQIYDILSYSISMIYIHKNLYYLETVTINSKYTEERSYNHLIEEATEEGKGNILIELLPMGEDVGLIDLNAFIACCGNNSTILDVLHRFLCNIAYIIDNKLINTFTRNALYAILMADSFPMCLSINEFTLILRYYVPEHLHNNKHKYIRKTVTISTDTW